MDWHFGSNLYASVGKPHTKLASVTPSVDILLWQLQHGHTSMAPGMPYNSLCSRKQKEKTSSLLKTDLVNYHHATSIYVFPWIEKERLHRKNIYSHLLCGNGGYSPSKLYHLAFNVRTKYLRKSILAFGFFGSWFYIWACDWVVPQLCPGSTENNGGRAYQNQLVNTPFKKQNEEMKGKQNQCPAIPFKGTHPIFCAYPKMYLLPTVPLLPITGPWGQST